MPWKKRLQRTRGTILWLSDAWLGGQTAQEVLERVAGVWASATQATSVKRQVAGGGTNAGKGRKDLELDLDLDLPRLAVAVCSCRCSKVQVQPKHPDSCTCLPPPPKEKAPEHGKNERTNAQHALAMQNIDLDAQSRAPQSQFLVSPRVPLVLLPPPQQTRTYVAWPYRRST